MISPPGAYHNDKCVMINPPGAYHNGGVNENLTPEPNGDFLQISVKHKEINHETRGEILSPNNFSNVIYVAYDISVSYLPVATKQIISMLLFNLLEAS